MDRQRLAKINQIAKTASEIYHRDSFKSVWSVDSVRTGKPYQVTLEWSHHILTGSLFTYDAKEDVKPGGKWGRPDNHAANWGKSSVCYQVLGAAKAMAAAKGKKLSFCKSEKAAKNLSNLGGEIVKIQKPSGTVQWAVVR